MIDNLVIDYERLYRVHNSNTYTVAQRYIKSFLQFSCKYANATMLQKAKCNSVASICINIIVLMQSTELIELSENIESLSNVR